jgi:DNA repair exonuclease SbcCD ATPase subunit
MATEMTYSETLRVVHCWCGIAVAIPSNLYSYMQNDSANAAYCPLGHQFFFSEGNKEKLRKAEAEIERQKKQVRATRDLLAAEERSHSATRGHLTRTKKRIVNGVCPCCNRHFADLERHMHAKHPDYAEA